MIVSIPPLIGNAVGDISLNGHTLNMGGGLLYLDGGSFFAADGSGNLQVYGTHFQVSAPLVMLNNCDFGGYSIENMGEIGFESGGDIINLSSLGFADSTTQTTAA